jgi:hypothetical protein
MDWAAFNARAASKNREAAPERRRQAQTLGSDERLAQVLVLVLALILGCFPQATGNERKPGE